MFIFVTFVVNYGFKIHVRNFVLYSNLMKKEKKKNRIRLHTLGEHYCFIILNRKNNKSFNLNNDSKLS